MSAKQGCGLAALLLAVGLLAPERAAAGPILAALLDCDPDCPPGYYKRLHYWIPYYYQAQAYCHPVNLNQYPPGPDPAVAPRFYRERFRCPYQQLPPTRPYADPAGYFGQPLAVSEQAATSPDREGPAPVPGRSY
jgi:hypothetical protein